LSGRRTHRGDECVQNSEGGGSSEGNHNNLLNIEGMLGNNIGSKSYDDPFNDVLIARLTSSLKFILYSIKKEKKMINL
jgi:hypothetical protein